MSCLPNLSTRLEATNGIWCLGMFSSAFSSPRCLSGCTPLDPESTSSPASTGVKNVKATKDKNGRMNLNDQVWLCGDLCERIWDGLHLPQVSSCHNFITFILPCSDFYVCMLIWKEVVNPHYVTFTMSDDITDGLIFVGIPHIQWGLEGKGFFIRSPWPRARIQLDQEVTRVQDQSVAHIDWWLSLF